jgi:type I restriction enzyme S subunit
MVPDGWQATRLGALATMRRGISYSGSQVADAPPGVPILNLKTFSPGGGYRGHGLKFFRAAHDERFVLASGQIVVANTDLTKAGDIIGAPALVPMSGGPYVHTHHVTRVDATEEVLPRFLFYALCSGGAREHSIAHSSGTTVLGISTESLADTHILLPPLAEQRKIAAILSSVDETIEKTEAVIAQLDGVKKAMLEELMTRGIPGRHSRFKQTEIGAFPSEWSTITYAELAADLPSAIQSGPFGSELKHSEFQPQGRLVVGIDNVLDGRFSTGANHRISEEKFESLKRFQARPGDLLITVMATVGRCCVVPEDLEPAIITKHVYRLSVDRRKANPYFLLHCLYGIRQLVDQVRGSAQGLTRPGLNKSLLLPLLFPLPSLKEQDEIVAIVAALDEEIASEHRILGALRPLKGGLAARLLSGEQRVQTEAGVA